MSSRRRLNMGGIIAFPSELLKYYPAGHQHPRRRSVAPGEQLVDPRENAPEDVHFLLLEPAAGEQPPEARHEPARHARIEEGHPDQRPRSVRVQPLNLAGGRRREARRAPYGLSF